VQTTADSPNTLMDRIQITDDTVAALEIPPRAFGSVLRYWVMDDSDAGFCVRVSRPDKSSERLVRIYYGRFSLHKKPQFFPIGSSDEISAADARLAARWIKGQVAKYNKEPRLAGDAAQSQVAAAVDAIRRELPNSPWEKWRKSLPDAHLPGCNCADSRWRVLYEMTKTELMEARIERDAERDRCDRMRDQFRAEYEARSTISEAAPLTAADALALVRRHGADLYVLGGAVKVKRAELLPDEVRQLARVHRDELAALLAAPSQPARAVRAREAETGGWRGRA